MAANRNALSTFGPRGRIDWTGDDQFIDPSIPAAYAAAVGAVGAQRHGNHEANLYTQPAVVADHIRQVIATYA